MRMHTWTGLNLVSSCNLLSKRPFYSSVHSHFHSIFNLDCNTHLVLQSIQGQSVEAVEFVIVVPARRRRRRRTKMSSRVTYRISASEGRGKKVGMVRVEMTMGEGEVLGAVEAMLLKRRNVAAKKGMQSPQD